MRRQLPGARLPKNPLRKELWRARGPETSKKKRGKKARPSEDGKKPKPRAADDDTAIRLRNEELSLAEDTFEKMAQRMQTEAPGAVGGVTPSVTPMQSVQGSESRGSASLRS